MMFWDENVQIWRTSPSGHLAGHKGCCLVTIWVILAHFCWIGNHLQLSYGFLRILLFLLILLNVCGIKVFNSFSCCVCGSGPTLGANIMFFANSFVATASTNTRNATFIEIVHSDLLNKTWIVHQQYENVTIEVSHSSMFKNHNCISILKSEKLQKVCKTILKTAGAVILQLALKLQKRYNFSVIPI